MGLGTRWRRFGTEGRVPGDDEEELKIASGVGGAARAARERRGAAVCWGKGTAARDGGAAGAAAEVVAVSTGIEVGVRRRRRGGVCVVSAPPRVMTEMSGGDSTGLVSGEIRMGLIGATTTESGESLGFRVGRKVCWRREIASATQFSSELQCTRWKSYCCIKQNQR